MITVTITGETGAEIQAQLRGMITPVSAPLPDPAAELKAPADTQDDKQVAEAAAVVKRVRRTKEQIAADEAAAKEAAAQAEREAQAAAAPKPETPAAASTPTVTAPDTAASTTTASASPSEPAASVPSMTEVRAWCNKTVQENPQGRAKITSALSQVSAANLSALENAPEKLAQFWALVQA